MASSLCLMWAMCACMATTSAGHGMMITPKPRDGTKNAGNNKGRGREPCGRGDQLQTQGTPVATYVPGQNVEVAWRIDARHGGTCKISLSTTGGGVPTELQDLTGTFSCGRNKNEKKTVVIPQNAACDKCVLQWFWQGDGPYYNCADIAVKAVQPATTTVKTTTTAEGSKITTTIAPIVEDRNIVVSSELVLEVPNPAEFKTDTVAQGAVKVGIAKAATPTGSSQIPATYVKLKIVDARRLHATERKLAGDVKMKYSITIPSWLEWDSETSVGMTSAALASGSQTQLKAQDATSLSAAIQSELTAVKGSNYAVTVKSVTGVELEEVTNTTLTQAQVTSGVPTTTTFALWVVPLFLAATLRPRAVK